MRRGFIQFSEISFDYSKSRPDFHKGRLCAFLEQL
jgi:hypothetical protein